MKKSQNKIENCFLQFHITGYALVKIKARVADRIDAGTNSPIYLKLKNRDTGEECETGLLDDDYDNWYTNDDEWFTRSEHEASFSPCRFFSPSQNGELRFNFKNAGNDDLLLEYVKLTFKVPQSTINPSFFPTLSFTWKGWHKFTMYNRDMWHSINQDI